jgi:thiosulfate/3-mercaptopyruvate sulfurtransferase
MHSTLISVAELAGHLLRKSPPQWQVIDCRFDLLRPEAGRIAYRAGHIPSAVYAHLEEDLCSPKTTLSGRHPLPEPEQLAAKLGSWGIDNATQVIAYDADNGAHAARLWWLLRWLGHDQVAVLDGGFKHWQQAGLSISRDAPAPVKKKFHVRLRPELTVDVDEVMERVRQADWRVLDARAAERYAGEVEPIDTIAGHVPGAHNLPFSGNLDAEGRFLPEAQLRQRLSAVLGAVSSHHAIAMCGSGVTACHNLLAMELAGLPGARLYPGSWSEWIRDSARPVRKSPQP